MLKASTSMSRSLDKRLDKQSQSDSQELFKPGDVIKESNGTTIQHTSSDSPDNKTSDKLDSPTSASTPNDSSEMSSLSESPSLLQDDSKLKMSNITATSITSEEDESSSKMDESENNRMCKKRRWDERDHNGNEDDGKHDENDKPRVEVQEDLKDIEIDFVQLRDQLYREQIQELDKEIAEIKQ
ncbi:10525_t:CDS:2, partial [Scutellospora calospora]